MFLANYGDTLTDAPLPDADREVRGSEAVASFLCVRPNYTFHMVAIGEEKRRQRDRGHPRSPTSGSTAASSSSGTTSSTSCGRRGAGRGAVPAPDRGPQLIAHATRASGPDGHAEGPQSSSCSPRAGRRRGPGLGARNETAALDGWAVVTPQRPCSAPRLHTRMLSCSPGAHRGRVSVRRRPLGRHRDRLRGNDPPALGVALPLHVTWIVLSALETRSAEARARRERVSGRRATPMSSWRELSATRSSRTRRSQGVRSSRLSASSTRTSS